MFGHAILMKEVRLANMTKEIKLMEGDVEMVGTHFMDQIRINVETRYKT